MTNLTPYSNQLIVKEMLLHPRMFDENIDDNIKNEFIQQFEGRCFDHCYIHRVLDVKKINSGEIMHEDMTCSSRHIVNMLCMIAKYIEGQRYIFKIDKIIYSGNGSFISARNGQSIVIIRFSSISDKFSIIDRDIIHTKSNEQIKEGSLISVGVLCSTYAMNDVNVKILGQLVDVVENIENLDDYYKE